MKSFLIIEIFDRFLFFIFFINNKDSNLFISIILFFFACLSSNKLTFDFRIERVFENELK